MMPLDVISFDTIFQALVMVLIVVQLERMIRKVSDFSDRLVQLETEHGIYHRRVNNEKS